jgi:hypothetical protein
MVTVYLDFGFCQDGPLSGMLYAIGRLPSLKEKRAAFSLPRGRQKKIFAQIN